MRHIPPADGLTLAGCIAPIAALVMAAITGAPVYVMLYNQDDRARLVAAWVMIGGWVGYLMTYGLASDYIARLPRDAEIAEPEPELPRWYDDAPILIPTNAQGTAGHRFSATPRQWSVLANRIQHGQLSLPVNQLSLRGDPFGQREIEQLRDDLIDAGLAYRTPTNRVYLNERGRVFVMLQCPLAR